MEFAGAVTVKLLLDAVKDMGIKPWFWLNACVTVPSRMRTTDAMFAALGVCTVKPCP